MNKPLTSKQDRNSKHAYSKQSSHPGEFEQFHPSYLSMRIYIYMCV